MGVTPRILKSYSEEKYGFTTRFVMNHKAEIINNVVGRFYESVYQVLEEFCDSKEEALDFIKYLEEERSDVLPLPSSVKYMLESCIEMNEETADEEGLWNQF